MKVFWATLVAMSFSSVSASAGRRHEFRASEWVRQVIAEPRIDGRSYGYGGSGAQSDVGSLLFLGVDRGFELADRNAERKAQRRAQEAELRARDRERQSEFDAARIGHNAIRDGRDSGSEAENYDPSDPRQPEGRGAQVPTQLPDSLFRQYVIIVNKSGEEVLFFARDEEVGRIKKGETMAYVVDDPLDLFPEVDPADKVRLTAGKREVSIQLPDGRVVSGREWVIVKR